MNDNQIRCFIAVAGCCNFGEAAKKLFISQATVSRNIAALEKELNMPLFERNSRRVSLTEQGLLFLQYFSQAVPAFQETYTKADALCGNVDAYLRIGIIKGQALDPSLKEIILRYEHRYPQYKVKLGRECYAELIACSGEDKFDVAVLPYYGVEKAPFVHHFTYQLYQLESFLLVSSNHPVNKLKRPIALTDFMKDTFVVTASDLIKKPASFVETTCQKAGFNPTIRIAKDIDEQSFLIEKGEGVCFSNKDNTLGASPLVRVISVPGIPPVSFSLFWRKLYQSKALQAFVDMLGASNSDNCNDVRDDE